MLIITIENLQIQVRDKVTAHRPGCGWAWAYGCCG